MTLTVRAVEPAKPRDKGYKSWSARRTRARAAGRLDVVFA